MYLEKLESTKQLKEFTDEQLKQLSSEVRTALINKLSVSGGHSGPNLGMVEVTIAMHTVFNSPVDKFVYDVSHQSYVHKILTGRKDAFLEESKYNDVSGYTNPLESEHDFFNIGHTSTSISLACGLAKARDVKGDKENIVALIGDGSLSGGQAYEGLNNVIEQGTNMIVIVNDNDMSIAENYGGYYHNLEELKGTNGKSENNIFKALGFEYHYVADGHNIEDLIEVFTKVKDTPKPVVVHVHTIKGKGLAFIEENKEKFHAGGPLNIEKGEYIYRSSGPNYSDMTGDYLLEKMKQDQRIVAISSATPGVIGMSPERRKEAGKQFVDVGIAEEHAVALASGIAKNGGKPVYGVYSTFIQRAYDQISQDLCINSNPAVMLVFLGSVHGMNDVTHLGLFDIPLLSNIPNLIYLAPTTKEEYFAMLDYAIEQEERSIAIKVPSGELVSSGKKDTTDYSIMNKSEVVTKGKEVAILALGNFFSIGQDVVEELKQYDMEATLINPKFISGLDEELLDSLLEDHQLVVTLEDGIIEGGFGSKVATYYGSTDMKVQVYGFEKEFYDRYDANQLLQDNRITKEQITIDIRKVLKK